ncbi:MAG TPA: hypothetical protein VLG15_01625, partial [Thermoanaerobaculia bacterium]|nr:hypothetical protein [Thermoanaerobaculia bacterium]
VFGLSAMSRLASACGLHPMAGGVARVRRDGAADYAALRRRVFGLDLVPLPDGLALSRADEETNRRAKLVTA